MPLLLVLQKMEQLVRALDRKTRQVFIEAQIVEVVLSDSFQWGINWDKLMTLGVGSGDKKYDIKFETALSVGLADSFGKLSISTVDGDGLSAVLEALSAVADTNILSNPRLTVAEGNEASVQVVAKQPYQEQTTTRTDDGTETTAENYLFVEVGMTLKVRPTINEENFIQMAILPEISTISEWFGGAPQQAGAVPVVKTANAETVVTVKNGVTVMIAGLVKEELLKGTNSIPVLGDLPGIGKAFRSESDIERRTETIIFLTPRIVGGDRDVLFDQETPKPLKGIRE